MQRFAIYDLDKTITKRATFTPFLIHSARARAPFRLIYLPIVGIYALFQWLVAKMGWHLGDYRRSIKEFGLAHVAGLPLSAVDARRLADSFAAETLASNVHRLALVQIEADRAAGCTLILATASNQLYADAIGLRLGFDAVICSRNAVGEDDEILPQMIGGNCYGAQKLALLEGWMARKGFARSACHIRFYSDHVTDAPCLNWADEGFATNAHAPLLRLAAERGWPCLDWSGA
jgi:HAD superfamily phosphoserine phosphatase-like hydrolase